MRSSGRNWESSGLGTTHGYTSSDDDEMTRLKPASGTSTSNSSANNRGNKPPRSNYIHRSQHSNSEGATSPNESDNTYAEASLLHQPKQPIRYDLGYDSEIYANDQLVSATRYQPRSPPISGTNNSRYIGSMKTPEAKSPLMNQRTATSRGRKGAELPPPPPPGTTSAALGRQMALEQPRGWDNGVGGYQTHTMLETRIGNNGAGHEDYVKLGNFTMMGDRRNRQLQPSAFGGAKTASLHRRSLSDDSLRPSHPSSPGGHPQEPIVMPGFPVRTLQAHPPPPYSPSREKFLLGKRCRFHCSWKLVALSLTVLTLILSSVIAYFGAVKFPGTSSAHPVRQSDSAVISAASSAANNGLVCPPTLQEQPQAAVIPQGYTPEYVSTYVPSVTTSRSSTSSERRGRSNIVPIVPGQWYTASLEPLEMWLSQIHLAQANTNLQLNLTVINGRLASVAIYGRREAPPTVTNYDWVHIVAQNGKVIEKRSLLSGPGLSLEKDLNGPGNWFIGVLNDNEDLISVRSVMDLTRKGSGKPCPGDCNGQGRCQDGLCRCYPQYSGLDCSESVCPLLCSGHGVYGGGQCHCVNGWKGPECEVRDSECVIADCSGHGQCREGTCLCHPGWTGEHCQTRDCLDRTCNGHGTCQDATCICDIGWMGPNCEVRNEALYQCLPDCSGHGVFNVDLGKCECHSKWTGRDCNITVCGLDCGLHGQCLGNSCQCSSGWEGPRCNLKACDDRCEEHGRCINGTCVCQHGFNGRHCSFDACGPACHGHGLCENFAEEENSPRPLYECTCDPGWTGDHCEIAEETECEDQIDNDGNGLTDCGDSKCCSHPSCRTSIMCMYLEDPVEVLLRKPPPAVAAPFLKRVQFLFEGEDSVQNYAKKDAFDDRRVSIIRGRVVTMTGQGIIGVRVSVDRTKDANNYGFTLTRPGGWFDMAVNGGGGVTLQFQRSPLKATTLTTFLPWNQIVVINPVIMTPHGALEDTEDTAKYFQPCLSHNYETMKPLILPDYSSFLASNVGKTPKFGILAELQEAQERIHIPGTKGLYLVYRSSSARRGAFSVLEMILTPESVPRSLKSVNVVVKVAGHDFREKLEVEELLRFTFKWDKTNIYNQKVYGVVDAQVSVGYEYNDCAHLLWSTQMVRIKGFDVDISGIGDWNLNIQHHYNPYQGVLQKGDGSLIELQSFYPWRVDEFLGKGQKRDFDCGNQCNAAQLLSVVSLASGPDGSLYIGDFNLIRRVTPNNAQVFTVLEFDEAQRDFDYDLVISPFDSRLYIAHSKRHQVWALKGLEKEEIRDVKRNYEVVVGTGDRCVPGDACGDHGPSLKAKLNYPKGLAISMDGTMYISDGANIRVVTPQGTVQTLVGTQDRPKGPPRPLPCQQTLVVVPDQLQLQWPTKLALNPVDNSLYIVDDTMILRLTPDLKLQVIAGVSPLCTAKNNVNKTAEILGPIIDLDFDSKGTLYFLDKKSPRQKSILHQVNLNSRQNRQETLNSSLGAITSLAINPDGKLYLSDNEALKILKMEPVKPEQNPESGEVQVADTLSGEVYTFNRFGQHIGTNNLETGAKLYTFVYTKNTALGKLSDVSDAIGNTISFQRDYAGKVKAISNTLGQKFPTVLSGPMGVLKAFTLPEGEIVVDYVESEGVLKSIRYPNGDFRLYEYDSNGKVESVSDETGRRIWLKAKPCEDLEKASKCLTVYVDGELAQELFVDQFGDVTFHEQKGNPCSSSWLRNGQQEWTFRGLSCSHLRLRASTAHPTLMTPPPKLNFGKPTSQWLSLPPAGEPSSKTSNLLTWSYKSDGKQSQLSKQLQFGSHRSNQLLSVHYDAISDEEAFYNGQGQRLLSVKYKSNGLLPIEWSGSSGNEPNCSQKFDRIHRLIERRCGQVVESFAYNSFNGRLEETRKSCQRRPSKFTYAPNSQRPRDLILPSGRRYSFDYDSSNGLTSIHLPGKTSSSIQISSQTGILGIRKVYLRLPGSTDPLITYWQGKNLVQIRWPSGDKIVSKVYNSEGLITESASGDTLSVFSYDAENKLKSVVHEKEDRFSLKITFLDNEKRYDFDAKSRFANAKFDQLCQENLVNPWLEGRIGGQTLPLYFVHVKSSEVKSNPGQFIWHPHNLNVSTITDGLATFTFGLHFDDLTIGGRKIYQSSHQIDSCGKIEKSLLKMVKNGEEFKQTWNFVYDDDGQLESASIVDNTHWKFVYDLAGNLLSVVTGVAGNVQSKLNFEYEPDGVFKGPKVRYDENGNVIKHSKGWELTYDSQGHLASAYLGSNTKVEYFYDQLGRLMARLGPNKEITQFFYEHKNRPFLISHLYKPRQGQLISLIYNHEDRLIFISVDDAQFYVVTDRNGSPLLILTREGNVVKEVTRSPFGDVTYDSNPGLEIPIGFQGGFVDRVVGLVHFQSAEASGSRAYDPWTGTFLTPQWRKIFQLERMNEDDDVDGLSFLLYRYPRNDPINAKFNPFQDPRRLQDRIKKYLQMSQPYSLNSASKLASSTMKENGLLEIVAQSNFQRVLSQMHHLSLASTASEAVLGSNSGKFAHWARNTSPLGKFVALSLDSGKRVKVESIDSGSQNEVPRDVFRKVLEGAYLALELKHFHGSSDALYFVKENIYEASKDIKTLRRLGPGVNLTSHDSQNADGSIVMDVKVHLENTLVSIRYGASIETEKSRILRHVSKVTVRRAWQRQKELILNKRYKEAHGWTLYEREQLLRQASVPNYEARFRRDLDQFPDLATDLSNVYFVPTNKRNP